MDYIVNNNVSILVHHLNKCTTQMKDVMEKLVVGGRMETLGYFAFSKPKTALKKKKSITITMNTHMLLLLLNRFSPV